MAAFNQAGKGLTVHLLQAGACAESNQADVPTVCQGHKAYRHIRLQITVVNSGHLDFCTFPFRSRCLGLLLSDCWHARYQILEPPNNILGPDLLLELSNYSM